MEITNKTLLITGIGGFIGLRAAQVALTRGMKVRGVQRTEDKARLAQQLGAEVVIGSINDLAVARLACQGVDIVLHTAAKVKEEGRLTEFVDANIQGTLTIAQAARESGIKAFVHLSSVMVYGFNYPAWVTEEGVLCSENNPYCQTKIESEQALLRLNHPLDLRVIIIRPGDVYGPKSYEWVVRPIKLMQQGFFILANEGRGVMNHVYVDNLIDAIFLALEKDCFGQTFNITDGGTTSWKTYYSFLAAMIGKEKLPSLPAPVLKSILGLYCFSQKLLGQRPNLWPSSVDFITRPHAYSLDKARRELGFNPKISLEEGMMYTKEWLLQEGLI